MPQIPSRWERWTIDEIGEGVARVLVSTARQPSQAAALSEDFLPDTSSSQRRRALRARVMNLELGPPAEMWSDERDVYLPIDQLTSFVRRRGGKPGLPGQRPLREGDVFWVVAYQSAERSVAQARTVPEARELISQYIQADADVFDVTAAARQAAKTWYQSAVQRASPSEPDG